MEIVSEANVDRGKPTYLTHVDADGKRRHETYQATDTVTQNFEAWADAVEGRRPYRFSDEELIGNIALLEALVRSSRRGGEPQKVG